MAPPSKAPIKEKDLSGFKYFKILNPLLERLHDEGTQRDKAGNRKLFFDQYGSLLLLHFFSPIVDSLRSLQQASGLGKVQKLLCGRHCSLGSLSEAQGVFRAESLQPLIQELAQQALPLNKSHEAKLLADLTAVDGSLLRALPQMAWALFQDAQHRAVKLHLHFDVFKCVPCKATVTAGTASEVEQLQQTFEAGRLYVFDRGYMCYSLYQTIIDRGASFVSRLRDNAVFEVLEERPLSAADRAAGVFRDALVLLGGDNPSNVLRQPVRLVWVNAGTARDGTPQTLVLVTNRLDLSAELIALAYKYRWSIELFFRWFKCILGCRHLVATSLNGVAIQLYLALIASLLISVWVGKKPTKRTLEMLQFYFMGWATEEELMQHIDKLPDQPPAQE